MCFLFTQTFYVVYLSLISFEASGKTVTAKGTGPQDCTGPESTWTWLHPQAALFDIPQIRRPCVPAVRMEVNRDTHAGSFAKYSDIGLVTISFQACYVSHRATGLPVMVHDMHTRRIRPHYLQACPTGPPVDGVKSALTSALCGPVPFAVTPPDLVLLGISDLVRFGN